MTSRRTWVLSLGALVLVATQARADTSAAPALVRGGDELQDTVDWMAGPRWSGPRAADVVCFGAHRVLPAGLSYHALGHYDRRLPCPTPAVAVVAGIFDSDEAVTTALRAAPAIAPGYPWVTHTDAAGLEGPRGIAVVVKLFASREEAERFRATSVGHALALVPVAVPSPDRRSPIGTHVAAARPVRAYSAEALESVEDEALSALLWRGRGWRARYRAERSRRLATLTPLCEIAPDRLFSLPADDPDGYRFQRQWRPVRCGAARAWVPLSATRSEAVVWLHRDGRPRLTQVSSVECDTPTFTTWELDGRERRAARVELPGGC